MTPLHVAAKKGECPKIVKYLIDKGTDINIKDNNGVSETIVLVEQSAVSIVQFCLKFVSL